MPRRTVLVVAALFALLFAASPAIAQTTGPSISLAGGQVGPNRILANGTNLMESTRPQNLNPLGISYQDCITDQTLEFPLFVTGFNGQNLQAWATESGDCTNDMNRGNPGPANCWLVNTGITGLVASGASETIKVRVQDLVGSQNASPSPITYQRQGPSACSAQPSFTAVPLVIYFIPVVGNTFVTGSTPLKYMIGTDLVGPPAPAGGASIADGDTLFIVKWTQNADSDTVGYDVYIDPIPGQEGVVQDASSQSQVLVCPETGTSSEIDATLSTDGASMSTSVDSSDEAGDDSSPGDASSTLASDASADSAVDAAADAGVRTDGGCQKENVAGTSTTIAGNCHDPNLNASNVQDGGTTVFEDGGEGGAEVVVTGGGISLVDPKFLVGVNSSSGVTVSGESTGSFTITGLKNGVTYTVAVSAVDAYGNIGPPLTNPTNGCDFPAPVSDFWKLYREAGGGAGGGICSLEAVGAPATSTVAFATLATMGVGLVRRRRRQR